MIHPSQSFRDARSTAPTDDELDELLSQFYQAELAQPWPRCPIAEGQTPIAPTARPWGFARLGRFAVAASVVGFVGGYLALQSFFPDPRQPMPLHIDTSQSTGFKLRPGQFIDRTPQGRPVTVEVKKTADPKTIFMRVSEELPAKK